MYIERKLYICPTHPMNSWKLNSLTGSLSTNTHTKNHTNRNTGCVCPDTIAETAVTSPHLVLAYHGAIGLRAVRVNRREKSSQILTVPSTREALINMPEGLERSNSLHFGNTERDSSLRQVHVKNKSPRMHPWCTKPLLMERAGAAMIGSSNAAYSATFDQL